MIITFIRFSQLRTVAHRLPSSYCECTKPMGTLMLRTSWRWSLRLACFLSALRSSRGIRSKRGRGRRVTWGEGSAERGEGRGKGGCNGLMDVLDTPLILIRFVTSIQNGNNFFSDDNGTTLKKRERRDQEEGGERRGDTGSLKNINIRI